MSEQLMNDRPMGERCDGAVPDGPFPPALLHGWWDAFVNRARPYAIQQADGTYRWVYEDCTAELLAAHLAGEATLALSSTDARGRARWACLDVDMPGSLPQLLALRDALAGLDLPGLVVGSRRGGHLWLLLDGPVPARALRFAVHRALDAVAADGAEVPAHELYPDAPGMAGALGHAVRLPLGVHRRTGRRYPPHDAGGLPCVFTAPERAAAFVLDTTPPIPAARVLAPWDAFLAAGGGHALRDRRRAAAGEPPGRRPSLAPSPAPAGPRVGTRSAVIRWVDARVSPLDLLAELVPESEMRKAGRGHVGWCPFHDDRAADAAGLPGTPSFYVVRDRRYGWSWRCLSTNCAFSAGPISSHLITVDPDVCQRVGAEARALIRHVQKTPTTAQLATPGEVCQVCEFRPWCRPFWKWQAQEPKHLAALERARLGFDGSITHIEERDAHWKVLVKWRTVTVRIVAPVDRFVNLRDARAGMRVRVLDVRLHGHQYQPRAIITERSEIFLVQASSSDETG